MYGVISGLDFGATDLKVCVIKRSLRELKLIDRFKIDLLDDPFEFGELLNSKLVDKSILSSEISTSITTSPISVRVVNFPFSDPKKIDQVYRFELEELTTFNLDEKLHEYHLLRRGDSSEALVCIFDRNDMEQFLNNLHSNEVDPRFVTFSPLAFSALSEVLPDERPLLLVDVSSNEMNFSLFDEEGLRRIRSSTNTLKEFLSELSPDSNMELNFEKLSLTALDRTAFEPLISEVVRTAHFFETDLKRPIERVIVSGDICHFQNIEEVFSLGLDRPVNKITIQGFGVNDSPIFAKSYALALYGSQSRQENLNLRTDEFKFSGRSEELRKAFLIPALLLLALLLLTFYRNISGMASAKGDVKSLQSEIQEEVKEVFPNVSAVPDPVGFVEGELSKIKENLELIEEVKGSSTPLDVLRVLTATIPQNLGLRVDELRFETGKRVRLWGRCNSYNEIATIEKSLSESDRFHNVKRDQVSKAVNNTVKFTISMAVK